MEYCLSAIRDGSEILENVDTSWATEKGTGFNVIPSDNGIIAGGSTKSYANTTLNAATNKVYASPTNKVNILPKPQLNTTSLPQLVTSFTPQLNSKSPRVLKMKSIATSQIVTSPANSTTTSIMTGLQLSGHISSANNDAIFTTDTSTSSTSSTITHPNSVLTCTSINKPACVATKVQSILPKTVNTINRPINEQIKFSSNIEGVFIKQPVINQILMDSGYVHKVCKSPTKSLISSVQSINTTSTESSSQKNLVTDKCQTSVDSNSIGLSMPVIALE